MGALRGATAIWTIVLVVGLTAVGLAVANIVRKDKPDTSVTSTGGQAKDSLLGTGLTPANAPSSSSAEISNFFDLAAQIGGHVRTIKEWVDNPTVSTIKPSLQAARQRGLQFHLYLSPIALTAGRSEPAVPVSAGKNSFADVAVRQAFVAKALEFASLQPDLLGIGSEVNLLAANPVEFENYLTLAKACYQTVKDRYPNQQITISFQWDVMTKQAQQALLTKFKDSLDVYSFTSYPESFTSPSEIPKNYYTNIRLYLPTGKIGISEIGWSSDSPSSEAEQAAFYKRLPELLAPMEPEFVTLALMHDVDVFSGALSHLNSTGIRHQSGEPKASWQVVSELNFN